MPSIVLGTGDTVVKQTKFLLLEKEVNRPVKWMTWQSVGSGAVCQCCEHCTTLRGLAQKGDRECRGGWACCYFR